LDWILQTSTQKDRFKEDEELNLEDAKLDEKAATRGTRGD